MTCDLRGLEDEFIRNRIVVRCRGVKLYETLIMISDLTLEGAVKRARQDEVIQIPTKVIPAVCEQLEDTVVHMVDRHYRKKELRQKKRNPL